MPKILIVDDEPHIRLLLQQTLEELEDEGTELLVAENGEEGLELVTSERPELVFLDVMMPRMSGYDVCHAIKRRLELNEIFVVLLTAKGQEVDKAKGKEVGADIYITKPFDPDEILARARTVLGLQGPIG